MMGLLSYLVLFFCSSFEGLRLSFLSHRGKVINALDITGHGGPTVPYTIHRSFYVQCVCWVFSLLGAL